MEEIAQNFDRMAFNDPKNEKYHIAPKKILFLPYSIPLTIPAIFFVEGFVLALTLRELRGNFFIPGEFNGS